MRRGVRQGDPLSPLLFDMVVDELLGQLEADGCGAEISGGVRCPGMAFADDFVLLAETPRELQKALDLSAAFFQRRGMVLNPMKSRVLVRRKVSGSIIPAGSPGLTVGQHQPLQVLGDDLRYLRRYATMLDKLPRLVAAPPCLPTEAPSPMYSVPGSASWVMRRAGDPVIVAALSSATVARLLGRLDAMCGDITPGEHYHRAISGGCFSAGLQQSSAGGASRHWISHPPPWGPGAIGCGQYTSERRTCPLLAATLRRPYATSYRRAPLPMTPASIATTQWQQRSQSSVGRMVGSFWRSPMCGIRTAHYISRTWWFFAPPLMPWFATFRSPGRLDLVRPRCCIAREGYTTIPSSWRPPVGDGLGWRSSSCP
jgi:hypothetical protein